MGSSNETEEIEELEYLKATRRKMISWNGKMAAYYGMDIGVYKA